MIIGLQFLFILIIGTTVVTRMGVDLLPAFMLGGFGGCVLMGFLMGLLPKLMILLMGGLWAIGAYQTADDFGADAPEIYAFAFGIAGLLANYVFVQTNIPAREATGNSQEFPKDQATQDRRTHRAGVDSGEREDIDTRSPSYLEDYGVEKLARQLDHLLALRAITLATWREAASHLPGIGPRMARADVMMGEIPQERVSIYSSYWAGELSEAGLLTEREHEKAQRHIEIMSEDGISKEEPKIDILAQIEAGRSATEASRGSSAAGTTGTLPSFDPRSDIFDAHLFRLMEARVIEIDTFARAMTTFDPSYDVTRARIENFSFTSADAGCRSDASELYQAGLLTQGEFKAAIAHIDQQLARPQRA